MEPTRSDDARADEMYARHGSFEARPGKGQLLASLLLEAAELLADNGDCRAYLVSRSSEKSDDVWVYEVWTSKEAHAGSLQDPRVMELIGRARPLIAAASKAIELIPVGGKGAMPDVSAIRALAIRGNEIFKWIADYDPSSGDADFEAFRAAAEEWILAAGQIEPPLVSDDTPRDDAEDDNDEFKPASDDKTGWDF